MIYKIDADRKVVLFSASGILTNDEMISCIAGLNADPGITEGMPSFTDARSVTEMKVTAAGFKKLAEVMENSETPRGASPAALLVSEGGNVLIGKLLVAFSESDPNMPRYKVFTDLAEAELWLGLSPAVANS
jgi:hypothetical protein